MALTATQKLELGSLLVQKLTAKEETDSDRDRWLKGFVELLSDADQESTFDELLEELIANLTVKRDTHVSNLDSQLDVLTDKRRTP